MNDLKFALRQSLKNSGHTTVDVPTPALDIGPNTAIFSVVNGVLPTPLPYPEPDRLVTLSERSPQRSIEQERVSGGNCLEWRTQNSVLADGTAKARAGHNPASLFTRSGVKRVAVLLSVLALSMGPLVAAERSIAVAATTRPSSFPHRIWAACDFEWTAPDYGWFGLPETNRIPGYPGNRIALRAASGPYRNFSAIMAGINPVPGPRMGRENGLFLRYFLRGGARATFQHFSLTREDNWHVVASGLTTNQWTELALDFTRDARRNDGSAEPFGDGERMDDFKVFAGQPADAAAYELLIDDVIFFANDPALPPEPEPFPNRVVLLAAFDTGPKEKYWPGDFTLAETPPAGAYWRAARSVPRKGDGAPTIVLPITPPRPVGAHTKLRFRYHLTGASAMTVQIFDATVQDNRHIRLGNLKEGEWTTLYLDFTRDARRNDGTSDSPFAAGNLVDDLFFFVDGDGAKSPALYIDEVVLFDAGTFLR